MLPVSPEALPTGIMKITIDGNAAGGEWEGSGRYTVSGGAMAHASDDLRELRYGFSDDFFALLLTSRAGWGNLSHANLVTLYFAFLREENVSAVGLDGEILGFRAGFALRLTSDGSGAVAYGVSSTGLWQPVTPAIRIAVSGKNLEIGIPYGIFPDIQAGDLLSLRTLVSEAGSPRQVVPSSGPLRISVPQLGGSDIFLTVDDPPGDDHGPGTYTYPGDKVFIPGSYDIRRFTVGGNGKTLSFTFKVGSAIDNPWGSGIGLSVQTFDIYIDTDPGAGTGARKLLEGRGAALRPGDGWEYAIWIEGWNQKILVPNAEGRAVELPGSPKVIVNAPAGEVTIIVSRDAIAAQSKPETWGYVAAVMSQDGFPSPGVRRIRDVAPQAGQWKIGGGTGALDRTRILDLVWNGTPSQEELLSDFVPVENLTPDEIPADDYAQLPLLRASE